MCLIWTTESLKSKVTAQNTCNEHDLRFTNESDFFRVYCLCWVLSAASECLLVGAHLLLFSVFSSLLSSHSLTINKFMNRLFCWKKFPFSSVIFRLKSYATIYNEQTTNKVHSIRKYGENEMQISLRFRLCRRNLVFFYIILRISSISYLFQRFYLHFLCVFNIFFFAQYFTAIYRDAY